MDHNNSSSHLHRQLDWVTTLIPFGAILVLCLLFLLAPERSGQVLSSIRFFLGDELGSYYLLIGLGVFLCSLYIALMDRFVWVTGKNLSIPLFNGVL